MSALHLTVRLATRLLEAAIALVVVAYLLLGGALLTLRYAVLPHAQQFVPWLEQASSRALGLPVHIGSVQSRWQGLLPTLTLHDLVIDDAQHHPALRLARVQAMPSWKSLPRLQLSFEQLAIRGASLRITREDANHLDIGGIRIDVGAAGGGAGQRFADWLFSQDQILVQDSDITWVDKTRDATPLHLRDVQLELRNTLLRHRAALRAVPPPALGSLLQLRADMHQPLFDRHPGNLAAWHGMLWGDLPRVDLDALSHWVTLPAQLNTGFGAIRAWLQVGQQYQPQSVTVVGALSALGARLDPALPPLQLRELSGRLRWQRLAHGYGVDVSGLRLVDADGTPLPPLQLQWQVQGRPGAPQQGSLRVGTLDLGALDRLAAHIPMPAPWRARLELLQPRGRLDRASLNWSGSWGGAQALPARYAVQASFSDLGWNSAAAASGVPDALAGARAEAGLPSDLPGIQGLGGSVDANQDGGSAHLRIEHGAVALPALFEAPSLPVRLADARLSWSRAGSGLWDVQGSRMRLDTPDASGTLDLHYTSQAAGPGLLDLEARLSRADARAVPRYLPLALNQNIRDYLRSAIAGGSSNDVQFVVRGPLAQFPFVQPGSGVFQVRARIRDGVFNATPRELLPKGRQARAADVAANAVWPEFRDIDGDITFTARGMSARGISARVGTASLRDVQLQLADYRHPVLEVRGDAQAPADEALRYVRSSPLDAALAHSLTRTRASGPLRLNLALHLPLEHLADTRVQGRLQLLGDHVEYLPWLPALDGVRGSVDFTQRGFHMTLRAAGFAGSPLQLRADMSPAAGLEIQADGVAQASALRAAPELRQWRGLLRHLHGSAPFDLQVQLPPGQDRPRVQVHSDLAGLGIDLPPPLGKPAETSEALRVDVEGAGAPRQAWTLDLGGDLRARGTLLDANGAPARWQALGVAVGPRAALPQPQRGVQANVELPVLDADAWRTALAGAAPAAGGSAAAPAADWLPDLLALRVGRLTVADRRFEDVVLGATRNGSAWQANLHSSQLDGSVVWHMGAGDAPGSISARLSRLQLPESADSDVERLLDEQPRSLPAIDLHASDVVIHGHHFDALELRAENRGRGDARQWMLSSVRLRSSDALLVGRGNWSPTASGAGAPHRMSLGFRLDVADAGALLARLGKPGLLKGGKGVMQGTVTWLGSPLALDYPTLSGQFSLNLGQGQFLKADQGLSKLLGVLSLQSLPQRLMFNFRDIFSRGFAFDKVAADVQLLDGVATTNNFKMSGLSATVFIDGAANLAAETQNLYVVVVPDINAGTASLAYALINPAIGLGTFIAQLVAREPLMKALTYGYHVTGTWAHPDVRPQRTPHMPATPASPPARPAPVPAAP